MFQILVEAGVPAAPLKASDQTILEPERFGGWTAVARGRRVTSEKNFMLMGA